MTNVWSCIVNWKALHTIYDMFTDIQEAALMGLTAELSLGQVLGKVATLSDTQLSAQLPNLDLEDTPALSAESRAPD